MTDTLELNKYLNELSKDELINEITKLHSKFKLVKEYYASELGTDNGQLLEDCKIKLTKMLLKNRGDIKPDIVGANKLVREFSSVSSNRKDVIDLMLHKVQVSIEYDTKWGFYYPAVETSIVKTYSDALKLISKNKVEEYFESRCKEIEAKAEDDDIKLETLNIDKEDESSNN